MSTICIHKRNQTYSLSCPLSPHCCTALTCFSKELMSIFHLIETCSMMQMFTEDPDFLSLLRFSTFLVYICAFLQPCARPVRTPRPRVITWQTAIDLTGAAFFSPSAILRRYSHFMPHLSSVLVIMKAFNLGLSGGKPMD